MPRIAQVSGKAKVCEGQETMHRAPVPTEFVFNPNWWFRNYGITFDRSFYMDRRRRIADDVMMRRALFERFGLGDGSASPRPILGSMHVAGGFVIPALFGSEVRFFEDQAPVPVSLEMSREAVMALKVPDIWAHWPTRELLAGGEGLLKDFGYVLGDVNTDGVLNTALCLRGQALFTDFYDDPELVEQLFGVIADTIVQVASAIRRLSGTSSVSVNRSILNVDPRIFLHANCSLQMISPELYRRFLLPCEVYLSERLEPFGIHHCGSNFQVFGESYRKLDAAFFDVGWGSDIQASRSLFPDTFLNLRLSPVRMQAEAPGVIQADVEALLGAGPHPATKVGICCINMDHGTPDENILAVLERTGWSGSCAVGSGNRNAAVTLPQDTL